MADNPSSSCYLGVLCSFEADGRFAGELAACFRGSGKTVGGLQNCPSVICQYSAYGTMLHCHVMTDLKRVVSGISFNVYFCYVCVGHVCES